MCFTSFQLVGIYRVFSNASMGCLWMEPRTLVVMAIRGLAFHPAILRVWMRGLYLLEFSVMTLLGNLLGQYVNSMNYMVFDGYGGGGWVYGYL